MERFLPRLRMPLAGLWTALLVVLMSFTALAQRPFVTTWKTDNPGESITIPVNPDVSGYNYTVDWGDGNTSTGQTGDAVHTYAVAGTYTVEITENFPAIRLGGRDISITDKLVSVEQWGDIAWQSMEMAFDGASNMVLNASDAPNLSGVSSLVRMFARAQLVNGDLSGWNVSNVTNMASMFNGAKAFNGNITNWNVAAVTDMSWMFWGASVFNQDIGGWEVGNVADMSFMFYQAAVFNQDLSGWDVSNVTTMNNMFFIAMAFDQSLGSWNISNVTDMDGMLLATGLSSANYGATLIGWASLPTVPSDITLDATGQEYCPGTAAETARQQLIAKRWTITGDAGATDCGGGGTNSSPTVTGLPAVVTVEEDATTDALTISAATIEDVDAGSGALTLTLQATGGIFDIASSPGITITGHLTNRLTLTGNLTDLNNYINVPTNIFFRPAANLYGVAAAQVDVFINDNGHTGSGGGIDISVGTIQVDITPVNDAPEVSLPATIDVIENVASALVGISFTDVDAGSGNINVRLDVPAGRLIAAPASGITAAGNGTNGLTISGSLANINSFFAASNVTYENEPGNTDDQPLEVMINDSGHTGSGGNLSDDGTVLIRITSSVPADPNDFITVWKTDIDGGTGPYDIKIPATGEFTYTWVDTNNPAVTGSGNGSGETFVTFPQPGTYEVRIAPTGSNPFHAIELHYLLVGNDAAKLLEVKNWGTVHWSRFVFYGCENLKITATDIPDLSGVTDLSFAFSLSGIDVIPNINDWDVSTVTDLSNLFEDVAGFNQSLDNWDVSNVTNMSFMFDGATSFNQSLDSWDVRKLENFDYMFRDAASFDQSLGAWKLESLGGALFAFTGSGMSCENFSYSLYSWATNPNTNDGALLGGSGVTYSPDVAPYVDKLRDERNWRFQLLAEGTCSVVLPDPPIEPGDNHILYVDVNVNTAATGYTGVGDSWENAIPELADALKWAREQHDGGSPGWTEAEPLRIFVAKGTYLPLYHAADAQYTTDGGRDNSFVLVPNVQLYGGFDPVAGIETLEDARILPTMNSLAQGSILSGDFNGNDHTANYDNHTENAHHVTISSGNIGSALMDGFTVTGGYARGNTSGSSVMGQTVYRFFGGGTYVISSSPQFAHMAWFNNVGDWGGGLFNTVSLLTEISSPTLSNVTFYRNMAPGGGGGIRNFGGSVDITQAIFANNGAGLVEDGTSSGPGGGIHSSGNGTSLSVTNATFYGNWIVGVFIPQFDGGAIYVEQTSTLLNNVVIWENEVEGDPTDPSASISVSTLGGDVTVANSLVAHSGGSANWNQATGILDGGNNIDTDPVFMSTTPGGGGYLQLSACSPAIGAGNNQLYIDAGGDLANDRDMGGNLRVYDFAGDGVIDMGAYEYQGERLYIEQLAAPAAVTAAYGTAWGDIDGLPTVVTARLSDDTEVSIPLDGNRDHWVLLTPTGGSYDGDVAGTYVFAVPPAIPEEECLLNPDNLQAEITIVVAKGTPVLTASWNGAVIDTDEGLSLTYGDTGELTFNTTDPDGVVTYALGTGDDAVIDLSDLAAVAARLGGDATLTIEQEGTDNYEAASLSLAVTVAQKAITIVPTAGQGKVYGSDDPDTYAYELAEGDELAFDDQLTDIVSATTRQEGEGVGAYDIELAVGGAQAGNYAFTVKADNDAFVITPLEITVTVENKTKVFGIDDPELTYTFTPELISGDTFAGELDRDVGEDVGDYAITRGNLSLDDNYALVFEAGTLTITPLEITVVADDKTKVFGTDDPILTYAFTPELVGSDAFAGGLAREGGDDVGSYTINQGDLLLGDNYEITFEQGTLTITPAVYEGVELINTSFEYDGTEHMLELTGELPEGATVSYEIDGEPGNGATDAGAYEITAIIDGGDNYEDKELAATLTITPLEIVVTATDKTKVFGSDDPALTYTFMPELIGEDVFTGGLTREEGENAGAYAIIQGNLSLDDNYEIAFEDGTLTITPAVYEGVELINTSFEYDGTEHMLELTGELPEGATVSYEIDGEPGNSATEAGTYAVIAIIDGGNNYEDAELTATLSVTPLEIRVTATDKAKVFGADDPAFTYTFTPKLVGDDAFSGNLARVEGDVVGDYAITQGDLSLDDNYEITFEAGKLTITQQQITGIALHNISSTYDGTEQRLILAGELPAGASVTYEIDGKPGNRAIDAGTYDVTAYIDGGQNYEDDELTATLTIAPLEITVSAADKAKAFGTDDPALTYTFTPGLIGDDVFAGDLNRDGGEDVGDYAITQGDLSLDGNYTLVFEIGTLTITQRQITGLIFENTSFTYDGTEHTLSLAGDLPARASVTYENNGRTNVGHQTVKALIDGAGNYQDEVLEATLTVLPAMRRVDFPALPEKIYGDAAFDAGATATSGEEIIYVSSNPDVAEVTAEGEIAIIGAGETTITATVPENANYGNRPQEHRTLIVRKARQTLTLNGPTEVDRDAGSIELTASSTTGLPVTLTADNAEVATLAGTSLNILRLGWVTITATQTGDANYEAAEPVTLTIRVVDPTSDLPVRVHPVISPNGDGINEFLMIEAVTDYPENRVTIFNRNGTLLWEASGYDNNRVAFRGISTAQQLLPAGTYFYIVEVKDGNTWKHKKGWVVLRY
ncbi:MBG domain-containing protein [Parapedobacter sp. 2B3]|uniref:MBG domain-containing protein n=1 Tax=Parapedobacter sp. 2B3 TaxID=3342381 RepID=UPI0035B5D2D3